MTTITFYNNKEDRELVRKIEDYQKLKGLKSRKAAVTELCEAALILKRISK